MKKRMDLDYSGKYFSAERSENIVLVRFTANVLLAPTLLDARDEILDYLDLVTKSDAIKVAVLIVDPVQDQVEAYGDFTTRLQTAKLLKDDIRRVFQAYNQVTLKIVNSNKFFIHVHRGKVILSVLSVSLAGDYRIAGEDAEIHSPSLQRGYAAKGAAFFLKRMLGHDKAFQVLLSQKAITARDALQLGLFDKVVPADQLLDASLEVARQVGQTPGTSLTLIKTLLNYDSKGLEQYFEIEQREFWRAHGRIHQKPEVGN